MKKFQVYEQVVGSNECSQHSLATVFHLDVEFVLEQMGKGAKYPHETQGFIDMMGFEVSHIKFPMKKRKPSLRGKGIAIFYFDDSMNHMTAFVEGRIYCSSAGKVFSNLDNYIGYMRQNSPHPEFDLLYYFNVSGSAEKDEEYYSKVVD
jgi:hypothetical protein